MVVDYCVPVTNRACTVAVGATKRRMRGRHARDYARQQYAVKAADSFWIKGTFRMPMTEERGPVFPRA